MNHDSPPSAEATSSPPFDESEVARVFDVYLADLEAGRAVDPERLLHDHPDITEPLRACLEVMHLADQMARCRTPVPEDRRKGANISFPQPGFGSVVLTTLDLGPGGEPRVHLRDLPEEEEPLIKPRSTEMPVQNGHGLTRFELQGEIARGGMGVVLKGRDVDLGRDLAIKVLLDSYQGNTEVVRRFVEEAQIGGQLQHPGVVPVYELGTLPDRRPFFAMKLVKGRTLASLLQEQTNPAQDLPRLLSIFEAVCQTMAYAHARGVIHRDLKPSNVMVGSFGEVQVMDWGLAKVLPQGGIAGEAGAGPAAETVVNTVRSGPAGSGSESQAGSVLGTPAYMAPEQARGEVDRIDERADVFGLGAILCEVLTGRPPYTGATREDVHARAERGDLAEALARIVSSGADAELIGLARDCLAPQPERRPRSAGEVARRMSAYQVGVQVRLKAAELARVEAQTRAEEAQARAAIERSRRRRTLALAALVLIAAPMIGGGWTYLALQRQEQAASFNRAVSQAEFLYAAARRPGDDLARWLTARDAARTLESLLVDAADQPTRRRVRALLRDVTQAATAAENDQKLLNKLVEIRSGKADDPDGSATDPAYAEAFEEAGIDLSSLSPAEAGTKIQARPAAVRVALAAALDDWASVRSSLRNDPAGARWLTEAARVGDPDPWRNQLRELLRTAQSQDRLTRLRDLARTARADELPAVSLHLLGATLLDLGDPADAEAILREAQRWYPNDVWLTHTLAQCLIRLARREEAIRYYMAARSLRPETAHELAHALQGNGETDQAIAIFQDLARLRPMAGWHLTCLSGALKNRGRNHEATVALDEAIAVLRAAVPLRPDSAQVHLSLGIALYKQGKLAEATTEYHEALRLKPDLVTAHYNLGNALHDQRKLDEAIKEYRETLRLKPHLPEARNNLGLALRDRGNADDAIKEFREALRLEPDLLAAHANLGNALHDQRKLDEAIKEYREALRLKPHLPGARNNLGLALHDRGNAGDAIKEFREALRLEPDLLAAHANLGKALYDQRKLEDAIKEYREVLRLKPDIAVHHSNLGDALHDQGKLEDAIKEYREALRLKPDLPEAHYNLGLALHERRKLEEAIKEYREVLRLRPDRVPAHYNLGLALYDQGKLDEAIKEYREALRLRPDFPAAHNVLGLALRDRGKLDEAITEYREGRRLKPDIARYHYNLGDALRDQRKLDEAIKEYREALRLEKYLPEDHNNLGLALYDQGKVDEAIKEHREALRLNTDLVPAHYNLGIGLHDQGKLEEAVAAYREVIRLKPDHAEAHYNLGNALRDQRKLEEAIVEYRQAIRHKSDHAEAHCNLGDVLRRQGQFAEALTEQKRGHELGSKNPNWRYPSAQWVQQAERLVELDGKLASILSGKLKPSDAAEALGVAQVCYDQKLHGASARYFTEAFQAQPNLADDIRAQNRYNAACAAALAGCGQGEDDPPPDESARAGLRGRALDWLRADLAVRRKQLDSDPAAARWALDHWTRDPDLAGVRDADALARLPEAERKGWEALWAEVDALRKRAQGKTPERTAKMPLAGHGAIWPIWDDANTVQKTARRFERGLPSEKPVIPSKKSTAVNTRGH